MEVLEQKKKKKWLTALMIVGSVFLAFVLAVIVITIQVNQEEYVVRSSVANTLSALTERQEIAPLVSMLTSGSLTVKVDGAHQGANYAAEGKVYFSDEQELFAKLSGQYKDLQLSANAYLNTDYMYIQNQDILGGAIGLVKGSSAQKFRDSIFAYGSGSTFTFSRSETEAIAKILEAYDEDSNELAEDVEELLVKYLTLVLDSLETHAAFEEKTEKVTLNGTTKEARIVTMTIDIESLINVARDLYEEVADDDLLYDVAKQIFASIAGEEDADEFEAIWNRLLVNVDEMLDELEDRMDQGGTSYKDLALHLEVVTPKRSSDLLRLKVFATVGDASDELFCLEAGWNGISGSDLITVTIVEEVGVIYKVTENTGSAYRASFSSFRMEYKRVFNYETYEYEYASVRNEDELFEISVDRDRETYTLYSGELDLMATGAFRTTEDTTTFSISGLYIENRNVLPVGMTVTVIIDEDDALPDPVSEKNVKSIFSLSEADIETIINNVEEKILGAFFITGTYRSVDGTTLKFSGLDTRVQVSKGYQSLTYDYRISSDGTTITLSSYNYNYSSVDFSFYRNGNVIIMDGVSYYKQ